MLLLFLFHPSPFVIITIEFDVLLHTNISALLWATSVRRRAGLRYFWAQYQNLFGILPTNSGVLGGAVG
jgi:hypothetical protein